jgi:hypothetical protein
LFSKNFLKPKVCKRIYILRLHLDGIHVKVKDTIINQEESCFPCPCFFLKAMS